MYGLNDRISVDGALGTVRYLGPVPSWEVDALGIEWDLPERGKHSGSLKGVNYFSVSKPGAGSFIKINSPRIDPPVSFMQALKARYTNTGDASIQEVSIGRKTWQNYGLDKLNAISEKYQQLPVLMVEKSCISYAGPTETLHATSLDLSYNLFSKWTEVQKILTCMPDLESINLNGNRIADYHKADFGTVASVLLSDTKISLQDLVQAQLPNVKSLVLAGNEYTKFDIDVPKKIQYLDLSSNRLEDVPVCACVQDLNISHNSIAQFTQPNEYVQKLDVRWNPISSYTEIDKIPKLFPKLKELKIDHIPVCHGEELFINVVCRVPGLQRLNGSELSASEVQSCELFFISRVQRGELMISNSHTWASLKAKHNINIEPTVAVKNKTDQLFSPLSLELVYGANILKRAFLPSNTVLRLKGIISTRMHIPFWQIQLYFYLGSEEDLGKQYLDNDMLTLENAGLEHLQKVFVQVKT